MKITILTGEEALKHNIKQCYPKNMIHGDLLDIRPPNRRYNRPPYWKTTSRWTKTLDKSEEKQDHPKLLPQIEHKNQQLIRIEKSMDFHLSYHRIPIVIALRIKGNLIQVLKKEFKLF